MMEAIRVRAHGMLTLILFVTAHHCAYWKEVVIHRRKVFPGEFTRTNTSSKIRCSSFCELNNCLSFVYMQYSCLCYMRVHDVNDVHISTTTQLSYYFKKNLDCLVEGYVKDDILGVCYKIFWNRSSWVSAQTQCKNEGAMLVKLDTLAKVETFTLLTGGRFWIGLQDLDFDGKWTWVGDGDSNGQFWNPYEPNALQNEKCTELQTGRRFNNIVCSREQNFICEL